MEVTLKDEDRFSMACRIVSILVLMEVTLKVNLKIYQIMLDMVSILVLMEVTLKARNCKRSGVRFFRFNPCFNGSDSKSDPIVLPCQAGLCFNPCFNGSDSKRQKIHPVRLTPLCFNPCFNGSDSKRL